MSPQTISVDIQSKWESAHPFDQILYYINDRHQPALKQFFLAATDGNKLPEESVINKILKPFIPYSDLLQMKSYIKLGHYFQRSVTFKSMARTSELVLITGETPSFQHNFKFVHREHQQVNPYDIMFGNSRTIVYADLSNTEALSFVRSLLENKNEFVLRPISKTNEPNQKLTAFSATAIMVDAPKNASADDKVYNESNIDDFDLKLTQYIIDSKKQIPATLKDITNNWPKVIREIENIRPTSSANRSLNAIRDFLARQGTLASAINGRTFMFDKNDPHEILNIINQETIYNKILTEELGLSKNLSERITSTSIDLKNNFILDYRNDAVKWLNDVETDVSHATWSTSVQELIRPNPRIRKNLINFVVYADPTTTQGFTQIFSIAPLIRTNLPIRLGLVPNFNLKNRLHRKVAFAFHHIAKQSETSAFVFLIDAFQRAGVNRTSNTKNPMTEEIYAASYQKVISNMQDMLPWERLYELYSPISEEYQDIKVTSEYLKRSKVPFGYMTMNGKILDNSKKLPEHLADMFHTIFELCTVDGIMDLQGVDIVQLLSQKWPVVTELGHQVYEDAPQGTGIISHGYDVQKDFVDFVIKQDNFEGPQNPLGYTILFCDKSADTTVFTDVMSKDRYLSHAINPVLPGKLNMLFNYKPEELPVIVINGRVFRHVNLTDDKFLEDIMNWGSHFINHFKLQLQRVTGRFAAFAYSTTMAMDFVAAGIPRILLPDLAQESQLVYVDKDNTDALSWKILADPTRGNFQQCIDMINYISQKGLARIQLMVLPPHRINEIDLNVIRRFYRTALGPQKLTFKFFDTEYNYTIKPIPPSTYSIEKIYSDFDDEYVTVNGIDDGDLVVSYGINGFVSSGTSKFELPNFMDVAELEIVDTSDESSVIETFVDIHGSWNAITSPGQFYVRMRNNRSPHKVAGESIFDTAVSSKNDVNCPLKNGTEMMYEMNYSGSTEDINIFVVTGSKIHEKLTLTMLLSAKEFSDGKKINVWMNKNDLSPEMKSILPKFCEENGMSLNLFAKKWPASLMTPENPDFSVGARRIALLDMIFPIEIGRVFVVSPDTIFTESLNEMVEGLNETSVFYIPHFTKFMESSVPDIPTKIKFTDKTYAPQVIVANMNILRKQVIIFDAIRRQILIDVLRSSIPSPDFDILNMLGQLLQFAPTKKKVYCPEYCEIEDYGAVSLCKSPSKIMRMSLDDVAARYGETMQKYLNEISKFKAEKDDYIKVFLK
ncbi:UDP-glucose:glycoprotein glucosyltransferase protein [Trichomonas vaginalis G3]|uniref:UDP-glucose:glycoprotein glucosyltransferase protein n=1 Tax=Trichomonas vaginalis (strain ATCC PRA-98 / G3) TaxID=412133 RepID=UPI0021E5DAA0|nr:UDP-glucose:glycoprotein glucosyltransferase protein [Trichomonas vaginalis G3]KAI5482192.1 UDP-glucose:glycoprotein glucosyltransferase protein [Trichomonas vaginalis G3]